MSNQLTDVGGTVGLGESVLGVTVNLLMCVTEGVHCTLYTPQSNSVPS